MAKPTNPKNLQSGEDDVFRTDVSPSDIFKLYNKMAIGKFVAVENCKNVSDLVMLMRSQKDFDLGTLQRLIRKLYQSGVLEKIAQAIWGDVRRAKIAMHPAETSKIKESLDEMGSLSPAEGAVASGLIHYLLNKTWKVADNFVKGFTFDEQEPFSVNEEALYRDMTLLSFADEVDKIKFDALNGDSYSTVVATLMAGVMSFDKASRTVFRGRNHLKELWKMFRSQYSIDLPSYIHSSTLMMDVVSLADFYLDTFEFEKSDIGAMAATDYAIVKEVYDELDTYLNDPRSQYGLVSLADITSWYDFEKVINQVDQATNFAMLRANIQPNLSFSGVVDYFRYNEAVYYQKTSVKEISDIVQTALKAEFDFTNEIIDAVPGITASINYSVENAAFFHSVSDQEVKLYALGRAQRIRITNGKFVGVMFQPDRANSRAHVRDLIDTALNNPTNVPGGKSRTFDGSITVNVMGGEDLVETNDATFALWLMPGKSSRNPLKTHAESIEKYLDGKVRFLVGRQQTHGVWLDSESGRKDEVATAYIFAKDDGTMERCAINESLATIVKNAVSWGGLAVIRNLRNEMAIAQMDKLYTIVSKAFLEDQEKPVGDGESVALIQNARVAVDSHLLHVIDRYAVQLVSNRPMLLLAHSIAMKAEAPLARRNEIHNVYNKLSAVLTAHDLVCRTFFGRGSRLHQFWMANYPKPTPRLFDLIGRPVIL